MQVTLKMQSQNGTDIEIKWERSEDISPDAIVDFEREWFYAMHPDLKFRPKEQTIEGIVVVDGTDGNNRPQKTLSIYTDNRALNFPEYKVYPEDEWYPKLASLVNLNNSVDVAPPRNKTDKPGSGYQPVGRKATFVPARYKDGSLVFKKDEDGNRKSWPEYRVQSVEGFSQASTNGNHIATNGAQGTRNAGATPNPHADMTWAELKAWSMSVSAFNHEKHATNRFFELVREVFDVPLGGEAEFLKAATDDKLRTLREAFIDDALERAGLERAVSIDDMVDEDTPF